VSVLAVDTATPATVAAFAGREGRDDPGPGERPRHASRLLGLVEEVVDGSWADVERIAVGIGPGGFTGLRIGIATARALAQGRGLPLVAVGSLAALARGAQPDDRVVLACIDARRGEAFAAAYRGREEILAPAALGPDALAAAAGGLGESVLAVGDGALVFRAALEAAGAAVPADEDPVHRLSGLCLAELAAELPDTPREGLLPDYCRDPDAVARA
jgi:tRNA threonylcarbamoyladenosine biosynthesis protein TsaB